jgi:hypothetical protein
MPYRSSCSIKGQDNAMRPTITDEERSFLQREMNEIRDRADQKYEFINKEILTIGLMIVFILVARGVLSFFNSESYFYVTSDLTGSDQILLNRSLIAVLFYATYQIFLRSVFIHLISIAALTTTVVLLWQDIAWILRLLEHPVSAIFNINFALRLAIIGLLMMIHFKLMRRDFWI